MDVGSEDSCRHPLIEMCIEYLKPEKEGAIVIKVATYVILQIGGHDAQSFNFVLHFPNHLALPPICRVVFAIAGLLMVSWKILL